MVLKLWEVDNGKVIYLKHTNSRNECRLIKLKDQIDCDKIPLSDLDKAIELVTKFISSIKILDDVGTTKCEKDDKTKARPENKIEAKSDKKVETKPENKIEEKPESKIEEKPESKIEEKPESKIEEKPESKIEEKPENKIEEKTENKIEAKAENKIEAKAENKIEAKAENKIEAEPENKIEAKAENKIEEKSDDNLEKRNLEEGYDIESSRREIPQEEIDKLNLLFKKDEEKRGGAQFLINKNAEKCIDADNNSLLQSDNRKDISIILRGKRKR